MEVSVDKLIRRAKVKFLAPACNRNSVQCASKDTTVRVMLSDQC